VVETKKNSINKDKVKRNYFIDIHSMKSSTEAVDARCRLDMIRTPRTSLYIPQINLAMFHFVYHLVCLYRYIVVFASIRSICLIPQTRREILPSFAHDRHERADVS